MNRKQMSAAELIGRYQKITKYLNTIMLSLCIISLVILLAGLFNRDFLFLSVVMAFAVITLVFLVEQVMALLLNSFEPILTEDCNPQKYAEVNKGLYYSTRLKREKAATMLRECLGSFYAGDFDRCRHLLDRLEPSEKASQEMILSYYHIKYSLYSEEQDYYQLASLYKTLKELPDYRRKDRQLLKETLTNGIEQTFLIKEGRYQELIQLLEEDLKKVTKPFQKIIYLSRLAELYYQAGMDNEALIRCNIIIEDANGMYQKNKAKRLLEEINNRRFSSILQENGRV